MTKLEVFDPPMCCASGVCGPNVDKKLVEFSAALEWLKTKSIDVVRYNPTQQYEAFMGNPKVVEVINAGGTGCLPLILVNGEVVSQSSYPDKNALAVLAGLGKD